jgi:virulence-associated protein VapD
MQPDHTDPRQTTTDSKQDALERFRDTATKANPLPRSGCTYAIRFDLNQQMLATVYTKPTWYQTYEDIRDVLMTRTFSYTQSGVYYGDNDVNAVDCVLAVVQLSKNPPGSSRQHERSFYYYQRIKRSLARPRSRR